MKTQLPSKYPWKSSREPVGVREPRLRTTALNFKKCPASESPSFFKHV